MQFDESFAAVDQKALEDLSAEGGSTRFHDALSSLFNARDNYGMKALVLLSDGHDLQDADLQATASLARRKHCKIFALPIGSEGKVRDLSVRLFSSQNFIFKGDTIRLSAQIRARSCEYEKLEVKLLRRGELLERRQLVLDDSSEHSLVFELRENETGVSEYEVEVSKLEAEVDHNNNSSTVFINCNDEKMRVLLLEAEPHWDTTFLRRHLDKSERIELDAFTQYQPGKISTTSKNNAAKMPKSVTDFRAYDIIFLGRGIDKMLGEEPPMAAAWFSPVEMPSLPKTVKAYNR
jgi:hypothetical protein